MSTWSKILNTRVGIDAAETYILNPHAIYHSYNHILDCYDYLEQNKVEYDEDLDYAVLYHDIVYDNQPKKERRSADLLLERFPDKKEAASIIMATETHSIIGCDWRAIEMIKADLHQLTDPTSTLRNYLDIMTESKSISSINTREFAHANRTFMKNLSTTIHENYLLTEDEFWNKVNSGIHLTFTISSSIARMHDKLETK